MLHNKRTLILLWALGAMAVLGLGVFTYAAATGQLSSGAIGFGGFRIRLPGNLGNIGNVTGGSTGYFANLSGYVKEKGSGKVIPGATVSIKCTNNKRVAGMNISGTNTSDSTDSQGLYELTKKNGSRDIKTRQEFTTPVIGVGDKKIFVYDLTAQAKGYKTVTKTGLTWADYGQGVTLPFEDFQLEKGTSTPTPTPNKTTPASGSTGSGTSGNTGQTSGGSGSTSPNVTGTGVLSGQVKVNGVLKKCANPEMCVISFKLTGTDGKTTGYTGLVNLVGYLIKSTARTTAGPDYLIVPAGTYSVSDLTLTIPGAYGTRATFINGRTDPASIVVPAGGRTNPDPVWLFTN